MEYIMPKTTKPKAKRPSILNGKFLTTDGLVEMYGIALSTQANHRKNKTIPYKKIGGTIYYVIEEIDNWIDKHTVVSA